MRDAGYIELLDLYYKLETELAVYKFRNEHRITPRSPHFDDYTRGVYVGFETAFEIVGEALREKEANR